MLGKYKISVKNSIIVVSFIVAVIAITAIYYSIVFSPRSFQTSHTPIVTSSASSVGMGNSIQAASLQIQENEDIDSGSISVTGFASVSLTPDFAVINVYVASDRDSVISASNDTKKAVADILSAVNRAGISNSDIETSGINIHPRNEWDGNRYVLKGYTANQDVKIQVNKLDNVPNVMDIIITAGGDFVSINRTDFIPSDEKVKRAMDDLYEKAILDAKNRADIYAKSLGITTGKVLRVVQGSASNNYVEPLYRAESAYADSSQPSIVLPGATEVNHTVHVVFAIDQEDTTDSLTIASATK